MAKEKKERAAAALDKMEEKAPRKEKARFSTTLPLSGLAFT